MEAEMSIYLCIEHGALAWSANHYIKWGMIVESLAESLDFGASRELCG
jgi:hypothetical protein